MSRLGGALLLLLWLAAGAAPARAGDPAGPAAPGGADAGAPPAAQPAAEDLDPSRLAERQLEELDTRAVQRYLDQLYRQSEGQLPRLRLRDFLGIFRGEGFPYRWQDLLAALGRALVGHLVDHVGLLGWLVMLAVLLAILRTLQTAFQAEAVAQTAYVVVYLALAAAALVAFHQAARSVVGTVDALVGFMLALLPLLVVLLAAVGGVVSAGLLQPALAFVVHMTGVVVARGVVPLILMATLIDVVNHLPGRVRLTRLAELLRHVGVLAMSAVFVLFLGVTAVQGAAGAVADGIGLRAAKFAMGSFVPVLGKMFADAAELVVSSSLLLKNALGLLGATAIIVFSAWPLLKVVALVLTFRVASALVQPLGEDGFAAALQAMAGGLSLIGVAAATVSLMFFLALTILVGAGNAAVMMR